MSRLRLLAVFGALVVLCAPAALSQGSIHPTCSAFHPPLGKKLKDLVLTPARAVRGGFPGRYEGRKGWFKPSTEPVGFWSSKRNDFQFFTTYRGTTIDFIVETSDEDEFPLIAKVTYGQVSPKDVPTYLPNLYAPITCDAKGSWHTDDPVVAERSLRELFPDKKNTPGSSERTPPTPSDRDGPRSEKKNPPKLLADRFKEPAPSSTPHPRVSTGPSTPAPAATPSAPNPAPTPNSTPTPKPDTPAAVDPTPEPTALCRFDTLAVLPLSESASPRAMLSYGLRNKRTKVAAFDYVDAIGEVLPVSAEVDVSTTVGRLTAYEPVTHLRGKKNSTWVSVPGARLINAAAERPKPRAKATLRMVIVSGAQELLISGLNLVGDELAKAPNIDVQPQIDWHSVEPNGDLKPAVRFTSFRALLEAAAEKSRGERMDVLNEAQLGNMFDQFEAMLLAQPTPLDRVIWIKGAYPIPGTFPPRLESFLSKIAESNALTKLVSGRPGKWFTIVTARILGFSIAYLKEPVYSLQAGDVIEEDPAAIGVKRNLIPDVGLFATRLRTGLKTEAAPDAAPDVSAPAKLVQDASDVFSERGYVLSRADTTSLHAYLAQVLQMWSDGDKLDGSAVSKFAKGLELGEPVTLQDILQGGKTGKFPRLPRSVADSLRKPTTAFTPQDRRETREFVSRYAEGVAQVAGVWAGEKAQKCGVLFITEDALGIVGNSR